MAKDKELHCSFCGKEQDEVNKLIAGTSGYICNECIELCHDMLLNEAHGEEAESEDAEAQKEQELAQQRAQEEKLAAQAQEQAEKNKKEIRVVEDNLKKQKDVVPQAKKKMTSQEKDNEKVKQVIANARKEVKPMIVYEPVSNVVAKSELTAKDRARARKALKNIRAEYFAKNK